MDGLNHYTSPQGTQSIHISLRLNSSCAEAFMVKQELFAVHQPSSSSASHRLYSKEMFLDLL